MTLLDFQRALADCVADGALREAAARAPETALADYVLTPRERARVTAALAHRGMPVTVAMYRANRLTVIHGSLPLTCTILGDGLRAAVDGYWALGASPDLQHASEAGRFAEFLRGELATGALNVPWLAEVLAFEIAAMELTLPQAPSGSAPAGPRLHPRVRVLRFGTAPDVLLARVASRASTHDLAPSEHWLLLDGREGTVDARPLAPAAGQALAAVGAGQDAPAALHAALAAAGLLLGTT